MLRRLALLILFALSALLPASPVPNDGPKKHFHPTGKGTKWVYKSGSTRIASKIDEVEVKGGETIVNIVFEEPNNKTSPVETLLLNEKGVFRTRALGDEVDPPICLLKLPAKVGTKWSGKLDDFVIVDNSTIVGIEEVEVPAGKFKAIRVELNLQFKDITSIDTHLPTHWYVEGIGLVKSHIGKSISELVEFTPAK